MTLPNTEVLTTFVSRVFQIDDVTTGDPEKKEPLLRYRGRLLSDDSASAYDQLAASVKSHGLTPLFRLEKGEQVIYLTKTPPEQKPANPWVNVILFVITVFSVMLSGVTEAPSDEGNQILAILTSLFSGWPFAVSMLGILLAHEFGHYLVSRYHKQGNINPGIGRFLLRRGIDQINNLLAFLKAEEGCEPVEFNGSSQLVVG